MREEEAREEARLRAEQEALRKRFDEEACCSGCGGESNGGACKSVSVTTPTPEHC